jgi:dTMP kinase
MASSPSSADILAVLGRFISLEGGEGVGKSTQVRLLAQALRDRGLDVIETREPGGSTGAEAIRSLLLTGAGDRWTTRSEALLFAAARGDHLARTILPALEAGQWVICDRFVDSSRAYQSATSELSDGEIMALHAIGSEGRLPDRTLLLAVDQAAAAERARARDGGMSDRIGERNTDFHARVALGFAQIAQAEPDRVRMVDAAGTPDEVTARLIGALADLLP